MFLLLVCETSTNILQDQHSLDLGACFKDQLPRRGPNALVRYDADAYRATRHDPRRTDGCHWSTRIDEDDDCKVLDHQLCYHTSDLFCCCWKLEGY
jgi:hypothetical protein